MQFSKLWRVLLAGALFFAALGFAPYQQTSTGLPGETICSLPAGARGVTYKDENRRELAAWGPAALAVAPDGAFWIADTAGNRLIQLSTDCRVIRRVGLGGLARGVTDLEADEQGVWALDQAAEQPAVLRLGTNGRVLGKTALPADLQSGLSGLEAGPSGVFVEQEGGAWVYPLVDLANRPESAGIQPEERQARVSLIPAGENEPDETAGQPGFHVQTSTGALNIDGGDHLLGLRLLGQSAAGESFVETQSAMLVKGVIRVDQTVQRYAPDGTLLGEARVPLSEQYTYVQNGLAVGPDGEVYALVTRKGGAEIRRLSFSPRLESILPAAESGAPDSGAKTGSLPAQNLLNPDASAGGNAPALASMSPAGILSNARAYINNSRYLSNANVNGACSGRGKPRYQGGAGSYSSVPYDWGGFDSVSGFNSYMGSGYQAGDINTAGSESCSRGVDCSGFVSRAWGQTSKYSSSTLPGISTGLSSLGQLWRTDILNKPASHVVLFASFAVNGVYDYEATTYASYDRVVYMFSSWSRLSGYSPRRYSALSGDSCSTYLGEYYNNRSLSGNPQMTRCEGWPINYDWGSGSPGGGVNSDNFSARWVGRSNFSAGSYTFIATADDGVRVWLDNTLIIDKWFDQGPTEYRVTRSVSAGQHSVQIDYYEKGGGAVARFRWEGQPTTSGNLALNRPVTTTSIQGSGYEGYRGNDGNTGTRWSSRQSSTLGDEWWWVDLGGQSYTQVAIRWEAAYAAQYFVGWSSDAHTFTGYWQNISAPGTYTINLGSHSERYVGMMMRSRAPGMSNYSFWEFEVYRVSNAASALDAAQAADAPLGEPVEITVKPAGEPAP